MKKLLLMICFGLMVAGELEVEGNLKVSGGIDAQGQPITNVGTPVNPDDAVPMSAVGGVVNNMLSLAGTMAPERIYRYYLEDSNEPLIVPSGKIWIIKIEGKIANTNIFITIEDSEGVEQVMWFQNNGERKYEFVAFENDKLTFAANSSDYQYPQIIIYEYSISGSGTSQGMNYVEP